MWQVAHVHAGSLDIPLEECLPLKQRAEHAKSSKGQEFITHFCYKIEDLIQASCSPAMPSESAPSTH